MSAFLLCSSIPVCLECFKGAGRKTPPPGSQVMGVTDPSCFLCTDNIRWQHRGVQTCYRFMVNDRPYNALCNPFPFMRWRISPSLPEIMYRNRFTSRATGRRRSEIFARIVADLYGVVAQLPTFVGFYNGAGAGASIEKHLHYHFFELPDGHGIFPLQSAAAITAWKASAGGIRSVDPALRSRITRLRPIVCAASGTRLSRRSLISAADWDRQAGEAASANIIVLWEQGVVSAYFIPRNRFYTRSPGLEGMVAGLETLGEFILCTEDEHRAIREQARQLRLPLAHPGSGSPARRDGEYGAVDY